MVAIARMLVHLGKQAETDPSVFSTIPENEEEESRLRLDPQASGRQAGLVFERWRASLRA